MPSATLRSPPCHPPPLAEGRGPGASTHRRDCKGAGWPGGGASRLGDGQRAGRGGAGATAREAGPEQDRMGRRRGSASEGLCRKPEGRGPSWLLAALQPHNGVILPGHRMSFVAHQPTAQPGSGGTGATAQPSAPRVPGRQVGGPESPPQEGYGCPPRLHAHATAHSQRWDRRRDFYMSAWKPHCLFRLRHRPRGSSEAGGGGLTPPAGPSQKGQRPHTQTDQADGPATALPQFLLRYPWMKAALGHPHLPTHLLTLHSPPETQFAVGPGQGPSRGPPTLPLLVDVLTHQNPLGGGARG